MHAVLLPLSVARGSHKISCTAMHNTRLQRSPQGCTQLYTQLYTQVCVNPRGVCCTVFLCKHAQLGSTSSGSLNMLSRHKSYYLSVGACLLCLLPQGNASTWIRVVRTAVHMTLHMVQQYTSCEVASCSRLQCIMAANHVL